MKKLITCCAGIFAIVLTGCQSPVDDMMNNNFVTIKPEPIPRGLAGTWSGSMGPYLVSMKWQADGHGLYCYSYGTADVLEKLKFSAGVIYNQSGTKLELKESKPESITVFTPYFVGDSYILYSDPDYRNASPYCAKALNNG